jgi:hypothetical protein
MLFLVGSPYLQLFYESRRVSLLTLRKIGCFWFGSSEWNINFFFPENGKKLAESEKTG